MLMGAPSGRFAVLVIGGMDPLPDGSAYQLWLVDDGERQDGGVFTVDESGWAQVQVWPSRSLGEIDQIGITVEPASGSPWPTSDPLLVWTQ